MNAPFVLVSDPGIDDVVALMLFRKLQGKGDHVFLSTFGNAAQDYTFQNAKEIVALFDHEWKVFRGSSVPLNGVLERPWPDYFHGPNGLWGIHPNVTTEQVQVIEKLPEYEQVISLGPLTDVDLLIKNQQKPIKNLMIMGGVFNEPGNETDYAETNIAFDPDGADEVFKNCEGIETRVVPLDVTRRAFWDKEMVQSIPENTPERAWIKNILLTWYEKYNHEREESFNLHDPTSVYLQFFPEAAEWEKTGVRVVLDGVERGRTVFDSTRPECLVAMKLKDAQKVKEHIFEIIFG